jgi:hypothetical protein
MDEWIIAVRIERLFDHWRVSLSLDFGNVDVLMSTLVAFHWQGSSRWKQHLGQLLLPLRRLLDTVVRKLPDSKRMLPARSFGSLEFTLKLYWKGSCATALSLWLACTQGVVVHSEFLSLDFSTMAVWLERAGVLLATVLGPFVGGIAHSEDGELSIGIGSHKFGSHLPRFSLSCFWILNRWFTLDWARSRGF